VKKMGGKDNWLERGETDLREIRVGKGKMPERGKTEKKGEEEVAREGEGEEALVVLQETLAKKMYSFMRREKREKRIKIPSISSLQ